MSTKRYQLEKSGEFMLKIEIVQVTSGRLKINNKETKCMHSLVSQNFMVHSSLFHVIPIQISLTNSIGRSHMEIESSSS